MVTRKLITFSIFALVTLSGVLYFLSLENVKTVYIIRASDTTIYNGTEVPSYSFNPDTIHIKTGTIITWSNRDEITYHTVTSANGLFDSRLLPPEGKFNFKFDKTGIYKYFCKLHPWMTGEVIVE
jgi:plastocyanin